MMRLLHWSPKAVVATAFSSALVGLLAAVGPATLVIALAGRSSAPAQAAAGNGAVTGQVVWCAPLPLPYGVPGASGAAPDTGTGAAPSGDGSAAPPTAAPAAPAAPITPQVTPSAPGASEAPAAPDVAGGIPYPMPIRPPFQRYIPAGAVLVAVQGTALSTRTDEGGRFRIDNVPSGQYWTVAAGPLRGVATSTAWQPNVVVSDGGQVVDLGRLTLGPGCSAGGPVPYGAAGVDGAPDAGAAGAVSGADASGSSAP